LDGPPWAFQEASMSSYLCRPNNGSPLGLPIRSASASRHHRVVSGYRTSTVAEATTSVLIGSTRNLHDAIESDDVVDHADSHG
jgi:hypothetical protein